MKKSVASLLFSVQRLQILYIFVKISAASAWGKSLSCSCGVLVCAIERMQPTGKYCWFTLARCCGLVQYFRQGHASLSISHCQKGVSVIVAIDDFLHSLDNFTDYA